MELADRRVLITGASRGIGEALAEAFAGAGSHVALVARSAGPLHELADRLGGSAHPCDLADPDQVTGLVGRVEAEVGPVDVLVNNAGIGDPGLFHTQTDAEDARSFQVNVLAPMSLVRQAVPGMLSRGGGHVVNVSSLAGVGTFPGMATYSATKAALSQLTAGLRADYRGLPLGTTLVELGPIPTDLLDEVEGYEPTAASFDRAARLQLLPDVPRDKVAAEVVRAVRHGWQHVVLPRRALGFTLLTEAPRRFTELGLIGLRPRPEDRP